MATGLVPSASAAIEVGASGSGVQAFATVPANTSWSTMTWAGAATDITDIASLDTAVQTLVVSSITSTLATSGTVPPSAAGAARMNTTLQALQLRPTGAVKANVLLATLQNTLGADIEQIEISYDFAKPATGVEEVAGVRVYYSLTGLADSWTLIPDLSTATAGKLSSGIVLSAAWADATPIYVLWVDDNSDALGDAYTLDNVNFRKAGEEAKILAFGPPENAATITGSNIAWYVPEETDVTSLAPTFTTSYGAVSDPVSGTTRDFTNPLDYALTAENPLVTRDYTVTVQIGLPPVSIAGNWGLPYSDATHSINTIVPSGSRGRLMGDFITNWSGGSGSFSRPVDTNGFILHGDNGGGNGGHVASGPISGDGSLRISSGPHDTNAWNTTYTISGTTANTYTGGTLLRRGRVMLNKTAGVDAWSAGAITIGSAGQSARVLWAASNQINDLAEITVVSPTVTVGYTADALLNYLDLAGFSERIESLNLADTTGKTVVRTGVGGVLNVKTLIVNGVTMPKGAYIAGNGFVTGTGYIDVDDFGPPVIEEPPAAPVTPTPADLASTVHPATFTNLGWADSAGATSYDVYVWVSTESKPETPTANVVVSNYTPVGGVLSLTTYNWQVVAKNAVGDTPGAEWSFTTVARWDIQGVIDNPNNWVGIGNTANLIGNATFGWQTGNCAIPVTLNEFTLTMNSGGGNAYNYTGQIISGSGGINLEMADYWGGLWDARMRIGGSAGNTYSGPTLVRYGSIQLEKSDGNALCGPITVGLTNNTARLIWNAADQIADDSDVTVIYFNATGAGYPGRESTLDLNGYSDTIASLTLDTGVIVKTGSDGVLTVSALTVGGTPMAEGSYTEASNPEFVSGSGSLVVGGGGASPYETWAADNAGGQSASEDYDGDGVANGVEFFMGATGSSFTALPGVEDGKVSWPHVGVVTSFEVQVSDNLTDWVPADPADVDTLTDPGMVTYTLPVGAPKKFCRLVVTP